MKATSPLKRAYGRFKAIIFATVVFSFFSNLLMFVGPLYMLQVYDRVLASRNELTLLMITGIAVLLLVTYGFLEFIRSKMLVRAGLQFDDMLANPAFNRVVRKQLASPNSGAHATLQDVDRVREFLTGQGILAFFDAPWVPLFLALVFAFHPWLGMVATAGALIIFILALTNEFATRGLLQEAGTANAGASHFVNTTVQNAEVIRALGMEKPLTNRWLKQHESVLDAQAKASGRAGAIMASTKFVRMSLQIAILGTGAYLAIQQQISPGIMIAASIVMGRALAPVEQAVGQWKQFVGARQAHKRLSEIFETLGDEESRMQLPAPKGNLVVQNLIAMAPGSKAPILKGISFNVAQGEVLAVIGPSGSGKSTLVRHIVGAMQPQSGAVRLGRHRASSLGRGPVGSLHGVHAAGRETVPGQRGGKHFAVPRQCRRQGNRGSGNPVRRTRDDHHPERGLRHRCRRWRQWSVRRSAAARGPCPCGVPRTKPDCPG